MKELIKSRKTLLENKVTNKIKAICQQDPKNNKMGINFHLVIYYAQA